VSIHPDAFVHESAYVDDGATIGAGTKVWHFCHVLGGAVIGERCVLGQNVVVMNGTRLGNNVKLQNFKLNFFNSNNNNGRSENNKNDLPGSNWNDLHWVVKIS